MSIHTPSLVTKWVSSSGRDCSDIRDNLLSMVPKIPSGIYIVQPDNSDSSFEVDSRLDFVTAALVTHLNHRTVHTRSSVRWTTWTAAGRWSSGGATVWPTSSDPGRTTLTASDTWQVVRRLNWSNWSNCETENVLILINVMIRAVNWSDFDRPLVVWWWRCGQDLKGRFPIRIIRENH